MKILITLLFFISLLFAQTSEKSAYERFDDALDKVSDKLSVEQKTTLYFLALSTQKNISSPKNDLLQNEMIEMLNNLKESSKIDAHEAQNLIKLYKEMINSNPTKQQNASDILLFATGIFVGFFAAYMKYRKTNQKTQLQEIRIEHKESDKKVIKDLQDMNNKLKKEINQLKMKL